ncbi:DNA alkylation repair protein [Aquincola tertiaricarbonis]|uniref:DNA alkylation repair protein n=1 Tax=Aquincola tertiaricarbonis TaxID=391953 RepID=A0ABY4SI50_AQUTE|nr:DNA alkylation repair protein [Aquincola tertiaricarbonis]URI11607.1 DNA alkylation repair protein [Aquincola tertiaricarbonis]
MAEPFKHLINAGLVQKAGEQLHAAWRGFDRATFTQLATTGLDALELKARARHVAAALQATLPDDFDAACGVLERSLAPPVAPDAGIVAPDRGDAPGLAGWIVWPMTEWVAAHGLAEPERALQALHAMTQRFTAEWALRPFIVQHPALAWATLARWCSDESAHVRRLVSEGSRPRLPWGLRLQSLVDDPGPTLPLLARLQDDDSDYVRRSVANHLNDIAKDHPAVVADWLDQHLPSAPPTRRAMLRHASRTLIKQGDARVLAAWGLGAALKGSATLTVSPEHAVLGGDGVTLQVVLHATSRQPQVLEVDYAVHHVKAAGGATAKVFKGWRLTVAAGEQRTLIKRHALKPITTRRYHAGWHAVDLLVNGQVVAQAGFELRLD